MNPKNSMKKGKYLMKNQSVFWIIMLFSMGCSDPTVGELEISFLKKPSFVSVSVYPANNENIEIKNIGADMGAAPCV